MSYSCRPHQWQGAITCPKCEEKEARDAAAVAAIGSIRSIVSKSEFKRIDTTHPEVTYHAYFAMKEKLAATEARLKELERWVDGVEYVLIGRECCLNSCGGCRAAAKEAITTLPRLKNRIDTCECHGVDAEKCPVRLMVVK